MFDSFHLRATCPHCKEEHIIEFQTKQFECTLKGWSEGDSFKSGDVEIFDGVIYNVFGGCNSKKCNDWQTKEDGYTSGFGRGVKCDVIIRNSKIIGAINVRKD